jgi:MFS family permease
MVSFVALDYAAHGWRGAGFALTAFAICYILVRLFFADLPDRLGGIRVCAISLAIELCGQLVLWLAPSETAALIGAALTGIGFSLVFPSMGVEATRRVAADMRGRAVGNFIAFFDIAIGATGPLAGFLVATWGYPPVSLAGAICCALALLGLRGVAALGAPHPPR